MLCASRREVEADFPCAFLAYVFYDAFMETSYDMYTSYVNIVRKYVSLF